MTTTPIKATTVGFPPDTAPDSSAWGLDFRDGFYTGYMKNGNAGKEAVWCVRGGSGLEGQ